MGMNQFSLADIMKSPILFKTLCLNPERVKVLDQTLKLIASEEVYSVITALAEEAKAKIKGEKIHKKKILKNRK